MAADAVRNTKTEPDTDESDTDGRGLDPLLVHPKLATGRTGQIERPGDDRPAWVIPLFFAIFALFIAVLVMVDLSRNDTDPPDLEGAPPAVTPSPPQ